MQIDIQTNTATDTIVDPAVLQALRDAPLLAPVDEPVLQRLARYASIIDVAEEIVLCRQGEPTDKLYIVVEGQLAGFNVAPNGSIAVIEIARPGETLSLASLLARLPRLVGIRTVTRCRLLLIESSGLLSLIDQESQLVTALLRAEANEFRALVRQVCDLKLRTTAQRLGCYLLSLSSDVRANTTALRLPFDKRLLAARLGCRQENLSRAFAALRSFGVETHGARVILHDIAGLKAYSEPDEVVI